MCFRSTDGVQVCGISMCVRVCSRRNFCQNFRIAVHGILKLMMNDDVILLGYRICGESELNASARVNSRFRDFIGTAAPLLRSH